VPTNLTATPLSSTRIDLLWTDNATNEQGFKVERSTGGGSFSQVALLGPNVTTYSSTSLTAGTAYTYRVRAYEGSNDSGYSNVASATTLSTPAAPSNLIATAVSSSRIDLVWADNATYEQGFKVERSTDGVTFALMAVLGPNTTAWSNTSLVAGTSYSYRVRAFEGSNDSAPSNTAAATTLGPPAVPSNLTATPLSSTRIDLAWTDNATNEGGFKVERSTGGGSFSQIAILAPNTTAWSNTSLLAGTTYSYRLRAYDTPNDSAYSNTASATTP
jgi:hypothetical protein